MSGSGDLGGDNVARQDPAEALFGGPGAVGVALRVVILAGVRNIRLRLLDFRLWAQGMRLSWAWEA
jgi:hypothetical protein